jgi:hypothetical protein
VKLNLEKGVNTAKSAAIEKTLEDDRVRNYLLLAYLDSAGYSIRSQRRPPLEQFRAILERYAFVAQKIQDVLRGVESELGRGRALEGDARQLPLENGGVQGILFSPPYSFAIDYVANDEFHLRSMGVEIPSLKARMIGLRGADLREKYGLYVRDMSSVLRECHRVLERGRFCTVVVGTNSQQLARILGVEPESVKTIDSLLVEIAGETGLSLVQRIERQITGMANTMRTEAILLLRKE